METIVSLIDRVILQPDDAQVAAAVSTDVKALMERFPLYPELGGI
jgi:glycine/serine hydroxymethyltransferase